jgi:hypothetical protein
MKRRELSAIEYLRLVEPDNKEQDRNYDDVKMPVEAWGLCEAKRCETVTVLADGYCLEHWDRGYGT